MQDGDFDMMHLMNNLEGPALDRLTATRRQQGSLDPEVEEMLAAIDRGRLQALRARAASAGLLRVDGGW